MTWGGSSWSSVFLPGVPPRNILLFMGLGIKIEDCKMHAGWSFYLSVTNSKCRLVKNFSINDSWINPILWQSGHVIGETIYGFTLFLDNLAMWFGEIIYYDWLWTGSFYPQVSWTNNAGIWIQFMWMPCHRLTSNVMAAIFFIPILHITITAHKHCAYHFFPPPKKKKKKKYQNDHRAPLPLGLTWKGSTVLINWSKPVIMPMEKREREIWSWESLKCSGNAWLHEQWAGLCTDV